MGAGHVFDDDGAELVDVIEAAHGADAHFGGATDDAAAGSFNVFRAEGAFDFLGAEVVGVQLVDVHEDIDLAELAADDVHGANAVDGFEGAADLFVADFGEFADRALAVDGEGDDGVIVRIGLGDGGGQDVDRELAHGGRDLFADVFSGRADFAFEDEGDDDVGAAFGDHGADFLDAADAGHGFFEGENDLRDDFFGAGTGELYADVDSGRVGAGEEVDAEVEEAEDAQGDQEHDQHEGEDRAANADFGKGHG